MLFYFSSSCLFYFMLLISGVVTMSSSHWMMAWVGMEFNMLAFLPLISFVGGSYGAEASGKYFLAQAVGSCLFLFFSVFFAIGFESLLGFFVLCGLLMKMGAAPFHHWFISVASSLPWMLNFLFFTWQKLPPLAVLWILFYHGGDLMIMFYAGFNLFISMIGGLSQTQLRPLLAYSSVSHLGWFMMFLAFCEEYFLSYLLLYISFLFPLLYLLWFYDFKSIKAVGVLSQLDAATFFVFSLFFLNLGGVPPLAGFYLKGSMGVMFVESNMLFVGFILMSFTVVNLAYYLNVLFLSILSRYVFSFQDFYSFNSVSGLMISVSGVLFSGLLSYLVFSLSWVS